jgi:LysM repeat protein
MKHQRSTLLKRVVLAATLLFVLAGLAPAAALAQGNEGYAGFTKSSGFVSAPAASPSGNIVYTVKPLDTLARIAARYGVTVQAILKANPSIRNPDRIYIGQRIVIPSGSTSPGGMKYSQVNVYLIGIGTGNVGCSDQVVAVKRNIAPTQAPLTAALNQLLSLHDQYYGQSGLYNALYQSHLRVQSITQKGTTWTIRLQGTMQLGGVCDIPRVEAQLNRTALQFSTVKRANFLLNGVPLKDALSQK